MAKIKEAIKEESIKIHALQRGETPYDHVFF
jgi:hypothetical protein